MHSISYANGDDVYWFSVVSTLLFSRKYPFFSLRNNCIDIFSTTTNQKKKVTWHYGLKCGNNSNLLPGGIVHCLHKKIKVFSKTFVEEGRYSKGLQKDFFLWGDCAITIKTKIQWFFWKPTSFFFILVHSVRVLK